MEGLMVEGFAWGVVIGLIFGLVVATGIALKWVSNRIDTMNEGVNGRVQVRAEGIVDAAMAGQKDQIEESIEEEILKRKSQIELEAMKKLVAASDEARRTQKPVTIEFAGITETFEITPPTVFGILRNNLRT